MRCFVEEYFKLHSTDYKKTLENLNWLGRIGPSEATLEMAHICQLEPRVGQEGYGRRTLKHLA